MISYIDELLKRLRDLLVIYHIPIIINGKNIKDIKLEKDPNGDYKIEVSLEEDKSSNIIGEVISDRVRYSTEISSNI